MSYQYSHSAFFSPDSFKSEAYRKIWLRVLLLGIQDYCAARMKGAGPRSADIRWLRSEDFVQICDLAGCDCGFVYLSVSEDPQRCLELFRRMSMRMDP